MLDFMSVRAGGVIIWLRFALSSLDSALFDINLRDVSAERHLTLALVEALSDGLTDMYVTTLRRICNPLFGFEHIAKMMKMVCYLHVMMFSNYCR